MSATQNNSRNNSDEIVVDLSALGAPTDEFQVEGVSVTIPAEPAKPKRTRKSAAAKATPAKATTTRKAATPAPKKATPAKADAPKADDIPKKEQAKVAAVAAAFEGDDVQKAAVSWARRTLRYRLGLVSSKPSDWKRHGLSAEQVAAIAVLVDGKEGS